jgi:hypothetical protein
MALSSAALKSRSFIERSSARSSQTRIVQLQERRAYTERSGLICSLRRVIVELG